MLQCSHAGGGGMGNMVRSIGPPRPTRTVRPCSQDANCRRESESPSAVGVWAVDPRVLGSLLSFPVGLGAGLVIVSCDRDLDRPAISNTPAQWARRLWASRGGPQGEKEITWGGCNMGHSDVFLSRRRCLRHLQKKKRKKKRKRKKDGGGCNLSPVFFFSRRTPPRLNSAHGLSRGIEARAHQHRVGC